MPASRRLPLTGAWLAVRNRAKTVLPPFETSRVNPVRDPSGDTHELLYPTQSLFPRQPWKARAKGKPSPSIDYGEEHNLIWVVALDDSGEIWCAPNPKVRMRSNWTMGRQVRPPAALAVAAEYGPRPFLPGPGAGDYPPHLRTPARNPPIAAAVTPRSPRVFRILALVALLLAPLPAGAAVTITFYSHKFQLMDGIRTDFPHGFVVMKGATADGAPVNVHLGFSAKNIFFDVLWRPVEGALDDEELTDAYVDDSIRHFAFNISDEQYRAVMAVEHKWRTWPQPPMRSTPTIA